MVKEPPSVGSSYHLETAAFVVRVYDRMGWLEMKIFWSWVRAVMKKTRRL